MNEGKSPTLGESLAPQYKEKTEENQDHQKTNFPFVPKHQLEVKEVKPLETTELTKPKQEENIEEKNIEERVKISKEPEFDKINSNEAYRQIGKSLKRKDQSKKRTSSKDLNEVSKDKSSQAAKAFSLNEMPINATNKEDSHKIDYHHPTSSIEKQKNKEVNEVVNNKAELNFEAEQRKNQINNEIDNEANERKLLAMQAIKIILFVVITIKISGFYSTLRIFRATFGVIKVGGNLLCQMSSNQDRLDWNEAFYDEIRSALQRFQIPVDTNIIRRCTFQVGAACADIGSCGTRAFAMLEQTIAKSLMFWFIHWHEYRNQSPTLPELLNHPALITQNTVLQSFQHGITCIKQKNLVKALECLIAAGMLLVLETKAWNEVYKTSGANDVITSLFKNSVMSSLKYY